MPPSPSKAILTLILKVMQEQGLNTTALAKKTGLEKKALKRILSGQDILTVDQLMLISAAIQLQEQHLDMLHFQFSTPSEDTEPSVVPLQTEHDWTPNPIGVQARQLLRLGFALGTDILFYARTDALVGHGIPEHILSTEQFQSRIPIRLDAAYHQYIKPLYLDDGIELRLSFDALYTCFFPWHSIIQVAFFVEEAPPQPDNEQDKSAPFLRVVK